MQIDVMNSLIIRRLRRRTSFESSASGSSESDSAPKSCNSDESKSIAPSLAGPNSDSESVACVSLSSRLAASLC